MTARFLPGGIISSLFSVTPTLTAALQTPRASAPNGLLVALCVLALGGVSCAGEGTPETYVRYEVDGQSYEVEGASLLVYPPEHGRRLLILGRSEFGAPPDASIRWTMPLGNLEELEGSEVDLSRVPFEEMELVILKMSEERVAGQTLDSRISIRFTRVDGELVEGSFTGTGFELHEPSRGVVDGISVSGRFQAGVVLR